MIPFLTTTDKTEHILFQGSMQTDANPDAIINIANNTKSSDKI